ncbi:MAG: DMT family transporter [Acidimicrobiales bacterium]
MNRVRFGYLLVAGAAIAWSLNGPFNRSLLDDGLTSLEIAFWRLIVVVLAFVLHSTVQQRWVRPARQDWVLILVFGLVAVPMLFVSLPAAVDYGGIGLAFVLLYTAPAFVAIGAHWFLGERLSARQIVWTGACTLGIVLVVAGQGADLNPKALVFGLLAGFGYSLYFLLGKPLYRRLDPVGVLSIVFLVALIVLVPFAGPIPLEAIPAVIGLGVLSTYVPYVMYSEALTLVSASRASVVATIEPVAALAYAWLIYDEVLTPVMLLGSFLVLLAATAVSRLSTAPQQV